MNGETEEQAASFRTDRGAMQQWRVNQAFHQSELQRPATLDHLHYSGHEQCEQAAVGC